MSSSLTGLASPPVLRLNPTDFERLGVSSGERVHVEGRRGASTDVAARPDRRVPRGVAALSFRPPGLATSELIDASERYTELRIESR
jgi:anaerobic selenocysteine-containing dehydrogenase